MKPLAHSLISRARGAALAVAVVASIGVVGAGPSGAASAVGVPVGLLAEHGPAVHFDTSAPLRVLPVAAAVARQQHRDSPLPAPTGSVGADPVAQTATLATTAPLIANAFAGIGANGSAPSDANIAVGPSYVVDNANTEFQVFSKSGASIFGPVTTNTIWSGFGGECQSENDGDGIVRYDALADRWIVSQFALGSSGQGPFYQCIAVSATSDPTGSYYRYAFAFNNFPDYPKLSVWPDGYYQTMNMFNASGSFIGADTCAYDRASMLQGLAASMQCFNTGTGYGAILPANLTGTTPPPTGAPDMQIGLGQDNSHLASFAFHVDWSNPAASTLTESNIAVAPYSAACNGGTCVPQANTKQKLDSLADRLMYSYEYRNFGDHESWVVNYSVSNNGVAAPRWYELRRTPAATTGPLTVYQESTYAPDSNYRWMGSAAMDISGDIALGYSESSSSMHPSIAFTGRTPADPLNTMEPETMMVAGGGSQTGGLSRWGDYSSMTVDPSNGCTFWYTNQYLPGNGSFNWQTEIGSFSFPTCQPRTDSDFSLALEPTNGAVNGSGTATTTVSVGWTAGADQTISLAASGLPTGVSASFSPSSLTASPGAPVTSTLSLNVAPSTAPGTYPIVVTASGPATTHLATYTLTVNAATLSPDFSLSASPTSQSVTAGASTSFSAVVTGLNGFSGTVSLAASGLPSGVTGTFSPSSITASGTSTLNITTSSSAPAGTYTVSITGTSGTLTHSVGVSLTIAAPVASPDFTISASPPSQSVTGGSNAPYDVTITPSNGYSGLVTLSVSGVPGGTTASFSSSTIAASGSSTLTVYTSTSTPVGTYNLTITGSDGTLTHSVGVSLSVSGPGDFSVAMSPTSQSVSRNSTATFVVTVAPINGFVGVVSLSVRFSGGNLSGSFSPSSITASGTSTLSVTTGGKASTYTVYVTGTSGGISHTTSATLTVTK